MHYFPAGFIGEFSAERRKARRDRPIWVARRDKTVPFRTTGAKIGFRGTDPYIYSTPESPDGGHLEMLWAKTEQMMPATIDMLRIAADAGGMPATLFINHVVPFVASLIARHPTLFLDDHLSELDSHSAEQQQAFNARVDAFPRLCDALLFSRRWTLVRSKEPILTSTDLGWLWLPGPDPGMLFLPVQPDLALLIDPSDTTYRLGDVEVHLEQWCPDEDELLVIRDAMTLQAPTCVFGSTKDLAEQALAVWRDYDQTHRPDSDLVEPWDLAVRPSNVSAQFLAAGAAQEPRVAWSRFMTAAHTFGCKCDERLRDRGVSRHDRRGQLARTHRLQRRLVRDLLEDRSRRRPRTLVGVVLTREELKGGDVAITSIGPSGLVRQVFPPGGEHT